MNTHSDDISELAVALAKAQSENGIVIKDAANPFFKLTMTGRMDLISVWRKSITFTITSLKKLVKFTMSGKDLEKDTLFSSGVVNYGMRFTGSMDVNP